MKFLEIGGGAGDREYIAVCDGHERRVAEDLEAAQAAKVHRGQGVEIVPIRRVGNLLGRRLDAL